MPIQEGGEKDIVADRRPQAQFKDKDGNVRTVFSTGKEGKSVVTWELGDGSTLTPYKDKDGKLHLGKAEKGKRFDIIDTVKTDDMIDREESQR